MTFHVSIYDNADNVSFMGDCGSRDEAAHTLTERGFHYRRTIGARDVYFAQSPAHR